MKKDKLKFYEKQQKMVTFVNNDKSKKPAEIVKGKISLQTDKSAPEDKSNSTDPQRRSTAGP